MPQNQAAPELIERITRMVVDEIAPTLEMDATTIQIVDMVDGVLQVRFHGACSGCPGSVMSMVMGIEQELRKRIPEVEYLEALPG